MSHPLRLGPFEKFAVWLDALLLLRGFLISPSRHNAAATRPRTHDPLKLTLPLLRELSQLSLKAIQTQLESEAEPQSRFRLEPSLDLPAQLATRPKVHPHLRQLAQFRSFLRHCRHVGSRLGQSRLRFGRPEASFLVLLCQGIHTFKQSPAFRHLYLRTWNRRLHTLLHQQIGLPIEAGGVREQLELIFFRYLKLLSRVHHIQEELDRDFKLERILLLLSQSERASARLVALLERSRVYFHHYWPELGEGVQLAAGALKLELRRVFQEEFRRLSLQDGFGAAIGQTQRVVGILRHALQESFVQLACTSNPRFDEFALFDDLPPHHIRSRELVEALQSLHRKAQDRSTAESEARWQELEEELREFRRTTMHSLFPRDWPAFDQFSEELGQTRAEDRPHLLHRLEVYLCTLLGEVGKRSIFVKFQQRKGRLEPQPGTLSGSTAINW